MMDGGIEILTRPDTPGTYLFFWFEGRWSIERKRLTLALSPLISSCRTNTEKGKRKEGRKEATSSSLLSSDR